MATFDSFQNILPDPNNLIVPSLGAEPESGLTGFAGPGYASVQLTSEQPLMRDRTNSGKLLARSIVGHKWKIAIKYNPMTQDIFNRVYSFLLQRNALDPFFVSLPQHKVPANSSFATYVSGRHAASNAVQLQSNGAIAAGAKQALLDNSGTYTNANGQPFPGDIFTVNDSGNSNHKKVYMITRVETSSYYLQGTTAVIANQIRISFFPGLAASVGDNQRFEFHDVKFRVVPTSDTQQYSLNPNNLYEYSLNLEEAQ
tara:strand:+ start:171 stop:938 length:768 start_codon:yes stop_codon:yes gene_type:complete